MLWDFNGDNIWDDSTFENASNGFRYSAGAVSSNKLYPKAKVVDKDGLDTNTTYYWQVVGLNSNGDSSSSGVPAFHAVPPQSQILFSFIVGKWALDENWILAGNRLTLLPGDYQNGTWSATSSYFTCPGNAEIFAQMEFNTGDNNQYQGDSNGDALIFEMSEDGLSRNNLDIFANSLR